MNKLDGHKDHSLKAEYYKNIFKKKKQIILKKLIKLKIMAKKTHLKVRLVPENNPDSKFIYYAKNLLKVRRLKKNLNSKNITPILENTNFLSRKNFHHTVSSYFFLKFLYSYSINALIIDRQTLLVILDLYSFFLIFFDIFLRIIIILFLSTISFLYFLFFITASTSLVLLLIMFSKELSNLSNFFLILSIFLFLPSRQL